MKKCKWYRLCRRNGKREFEVLTCTECSVTPRWLVDWWLKETSCMLAQVNIYEWVDTVNCLFTAPLVCNALVFRAHTPTRHFQPISWESACWALVCIWWAVWSALSGASCTRINVASVWAGCFLTVTMAFPHSFLLFLLSCTLLNHGYARPNRSRKAVAGRGNVFRTEKEITYRKEIEACNYFNELNSWLYILCA